jgi:hypothetical protein
LSSSGRWGRCGRFRGFGASLKQLENGKPGTPTVKAHLFIDPTLKLFVIYETTFLSECGLDWAARSLSVPPTAKPAGGLLDRLCPFKRCRKHGRIVNQANLPGRDCGLVCSAFGSGTVPLPVLESFDEILCFPEEFPKPRSSSSSCAVRFGERGSDADGGTTGIDDSSINDTKPEDEDGWSLGNIEAVGVVVVDSSVLEEPHQVLELEPGHGASLSSCW